MRQSLSPTPLLISPSQLAQTISSQDTVLLDTTWFMPNSSRQADKEFFEKRIDNARFLNLDIVASEHELGLKHMMPEPSVFAEACGKLGIRATSHVVLYDSHGVFTSPRALFMFRAFGHTNSSVLDGGLPRWEIEGLPIQSAAPVDVTPTQYDTPQLDESTIKNYEQMVSNSCMQADIAEIVLDARPTARYLGTTPEPRPGLPSGHMPNSYSLPFSAFLQTNSDGNQSYTSFLPPSDIQKALISAVGEDHTTAILAGRRSVITSCGSGMTAGVLWLGLRLLSDSTKIGLYDESWAGYAARESSTILLNN